MKVREAGPEDLEVILKIYGQARQFMREHGNAGQWGASYPSADLIRQDIARKQSFVETGDDGTVHGVFMFFIGTEPTYGRIENGSWLNDRPYGTIHRIAGDGTEKGVFADCLAWCLGKTGNIRADTHRQNIPMQRVLEKNGFRKCGIIHIEDGSERIAYQRCL